VSPERARWLAIAGLVVAAFGFAAMLATAAAFVWLSRSAEPASVWIDALVVLVFAGLLAGSWAFLVSRWKMLRGASPGAAGGRDRWTRLSRRLFGLVFVVLFATWLATILVQSLR
jgi:hypothetical protein